jgi:hypothetical protein
MSRGHGLHKLAGGIAKRERDEWTHLAAGWTCALRDCERPGAALIRDWTGTGRPVCEAHAAQAHAAGRTPEYPPPAPSPTATQEATP